MKIIDKTYKELMDLKCRKQGWYYTWLIDIKVEGFKPIKATYTQTSIKTNKLIAKGNVIY